MSLFDKLKHKIKKVAEQGEDLVRDQKTRFDISTLRRQKQEIFTVLGEEIYKRESKGQAFEDVLRRHMEELRELDRDIARLETAARTGTPPPPADKGSDLDITLTSEDQEYDPIEIELAPREEDRTTADSADAPESGEEPEDHETAAN